jgi:hypothetical protein
MDDQVGDTMRTEPSVERGVGRWLGSRRAIPTLVAILWLALGAVPLAGTLDAATAYAASATTTPPSTTQPATTVASTAATNVATTVPTTAATTAPATTAPATTAPTTTTGPSTTTTTTAPTTLTTKRRVVVGIAATRGLVVSEESGNTQSGWIAFGIILVVVLGLAVAWFVHERRRQGPAGRGSNKPTA